MVTRLSLYLPACNRIGFASMLSLAASRPDMKAFGSRLYGTAMTTTTAIRNDCYTYVPTHHRHVSVRNAIIILWYTFPLARSPEICNTTATKVSPAPILETLGSQNRCKFWGMVGILWQLEEQSCNIRPPRNAGRAGISKLCIGPTCNETLRAQTDTQRKNETCIDKSEPTTNINEVRMNMNNI